MMLLCANAGTDLCTTYENNTDEVDSDGRPPHSVEVVVDGGEDAAIAQEIWRLKAGGIDTYGSESALASDVKGMLHTIHFNRPDRIKIWLKVTVSKNPDRDLAPSAASDIAKALLAKGQAQTMGEDVVLQRYFAAVFQAAPGVGYISLTATSGDTAGTYRTDNIDISLRQIAAFDAARIEVNVS